jgi:hypothetical protein
MRALDDDGVACYDDCAVENVQRGKQGRGGVALVIVRDGAEAGCGQRLDGPWISRSAILGRYKEPRQLI